MGTGIAVGAGRHHRQDQSQGGARGECRRQEAAAAGNRNLGTGPGSHFRREGSSRSRRKMAFLSQVSEGD